MNKREREPLLALGIYQVYEGRLLLLGSICPCLIVMVIKIYYSELLPEAFIPIRGIDGSMPADTRLKSLERER